MVYVVINDFGRNMGLFGFRWLGRVHRGEERKGLLNGCIDRRERWEGVMGVLD